MSGSCNTCGEKFDSKEAFDIHNAEKHPFCKICLDMMKDLTPRGQMLFFVHLKTVHPPQFIPRCKVCKKPNHNQTDMCLECTENTKHLGITNHCSECKKEIPHGTKKCPECIMEEDDFDDYDCHDYNSDDDDDDDVDDDDDDDVGDDVVAVVADVPTVIPWGSFPLDS